MEGDDHAKTANPHRPGSQLIRAQNPVCTKNYLTFAGKNSKDFLLYISGPGVYDSPEADVELTSVPGKNGDIIRENAKSGQRRFKNIDITYDVFFFDSLPARTAAVKSWLLSPVGYQVLHDTYDPDFFRMAFCKDAVSFETKGKKGASMELTFHCQPQRWSIEGQKKVKLLRPGVIRNPYEFRQRGSEALCRHGANHYQCPGGLCGPKL